MASAAPTSLDFTLRFVDGRGLLGLRERAPLEIASVEKLELEVPNLRFPFDVSGGAERFQTRRCVLCRVELRIEEERLQAFLDGRTELARYGVRDLRARVADDRIEIEARVRLGEREAGVTARMRLGAGGQSLRGYLYDVRVYGSLGAPAPLIGLGLLYAAGARPRPAAAAGTAAAGALAPGARIDGLDRIELDPLKLVLLRALPERGWRLPRSREVALTQIQLQRGEIALAWAQESALPADTATPSVSQLDSLHTAALPGDRRLEAGDLLGALQIYGQVTAVDERPELAERELAVKAALPARASEAVALGARLLETHPTRPFALLTIAALDSERGEHKRAGERYARAAEMAEAAGERADAVFGAVAAAIEFARAGRGPDATLWLERALAERSDEPRALELLAERYAAEGRHRDLLQLEKRRLQRADGPAAEAEIRARIGRLLLEQLGDPTRAAAELEASLRIHGGSAEVQRLYARALDAAGDTARALDAIGRAAQLAVLDADGRVALHLEAAAIAERAGAAEAALEHFEGALTLTPDHPEAQLGRAGMLEKLHRTADAITAYERALRTAPAAETRATLLCRLARIAREALGDPGQARAYVERSLEIVPTPDALRLAASLAEAEGRTDDLERLLRTLATGGDRDAQLQRARLLFGLARFDEAAEAAESLAGYRPAEALPVLVAAQEALGDLERVQASLERLIAARPGDAGPRVRLARIVADQGDLERARTLLSETLAGTPADSDLREALEAQCDVLLRIGDDAALDEALGRLAQVRSDPRGRSRTLSAQGAARARLGLTAEAADAYHAALALEPDDAQALAGLGEAAWALRRFAEARAALEPLHARGLPPRVERALRLGEISERLAQPAQAITFYQAALEAGASGLDGVRAWNALVGLYHARADFDAEGKAQLAAAGDERTGEREQARASRLSAAADLIRKHAGRPDEARDLYEQALKLDPSALGALDALEVLAEATGDPAQVVHVLARKVAATARRPAQQKAILGRLAELQAGRLGRPDAAREAYQRALELDPDYRPALAFLAEDARVRGDAADERARLERLAALPPEPGDPEARANELLRLATLHRQHGSLAESEKWARRVLEVHPRHAGALALLDDLYTQGGRTEELASVLGERAAAEGAAAPVAELLSRRAALFEGAGRRPEAISAYEELVTLRPAHLAAWNRLAALLRLEEAWQRLADVLTRLGERHLADGRPSEAEALYVEVAHLYFDRLQDREHAKEALTRALEVAPGSRVALAGLLTLARERSDVAEEDALLGRLADAEERPQARALAVAERARGRATRGDVEGALLLLREVDVETAPESVLRMRIELEEARAGKAVAPESVPALEALRARARAAGDLSAEKWAVRKLARLAVERGPSPAAQEILRRAAELDPDDREAIRALAVVERARGDDPAYLECLDRLLRAARRALEGAEREAEIGVEMARVLTRLGDFDQARQRLREALEAAPAFGEAHRMVGTLLRRTGAPMEAATAFERAAELGALDESGLSELGEIYLDRGDASRAAAAFTKAGAAAPPRRLAEALEKAGREAEAIQVWRSQPSEEAKGALARLQRRRAQRALEAGRTPEAREAAIEALAIDPADEQALSWALSGLSPAAALALLDELSQRIRPADAAALYRRVASHLGGDEARFALERAVELLPDVATLVALGDRERGAQAARRYQSALELEPASVEAARGLLREARPEAAAEILTQAHHASPEGPARARLSSLLGALHRDRLNQPTRAREHYQRAVAESQRGDETRAEALRSLAALAHAARDGRAATEALETLHKEGAALDPDLRHLAELYAERSDYSAAITLLDGLPGSADLLLQYLEAAGRHDELVRLLENEALRRTPDEARTFYLRAATLAQGPLGDPRRAAQLLERALPLGPADAELWARLAATYQALGEREKAALAYARAHAADRERTDVLLPLADYHHDANEWQPAADYYELALAANAIPEAELARVHLRRAEYARALADAVAEEVALRAAISAGLKPPPWARLAKLYRARGDGRRLAEALQHLAEDARGAERAQLLREAAGHLPPEEAAALYEQIAEDDPDDEAARDRVLERLRATGDRAALVARLEREVEKSRPPRRGRLWLELGHLAEQAGDLPRAAAAYRAALADLPGAAAAHALLGLLAKRGTEAEAQAALETALFEPALPPSERDEVLALATRVHLAAGGAAALAFVGRALAAGLTPLVPPETWRALLRSQQRFQELVAALDDAYAGERDPSVRPALALEACDLLAEQLAQPAEAARRAATLLAAHPHRRDIAERARRFYAAAGDAKRALEILEHEMKLAGPDELPQLKIIRGELLLDAGLDNEAEAEFLHALITTKRVGRAHAALANVYSKRGDLAGSLEHLIAAADSSDLEPARAARCAVEAADVLLREGDATTAERLYQLAAALDAADRHAVEGLAKLAQARGDYERVCDLLGRSALLTPDRHERARLALERAKIYQNDLNRDVEAYRAYKEAVACDPQLREAARGLRAMAEARGEWALAAEQLYREIAATDDEAVRAQLHIELARLLEEKLLDAEEALRNYEQAAATLSALAGGRGAPWTDLARLYVSLGKLREAAAASDRLGDSLAQDPPRQAEALERAAELYERLGDGEAARTRLARAAALGGEAGRRADDSLLRMADDAGDPAELRRRIEERLAVEPEGELRIQLLRRLLTLAAQASDWGEVDMRSQELLARAPDDPLAFVERKRVLERRGDQAAVARLLRARAAAVEDAQEKAARRFEAGRLAERMGDAAAAFADYEAALAVDAAHVPALDALADLAYRSRQTSRARSLYNALGARPSALAPDEVLRRRAELAEESGDIEEALRLYQAAAMQNAHNLPAYEALARLHGERGDQPAAFTALKAVLDLLPLDAVDRITELRQKLGRLALKIGEPDQARHYFELVLAQDPMRADALEALAQLYTQSGAWEEAAQACSRLSYLVEKPQERAELLYRRGEILRTRLGDLDRANDAYLKAADLHPTHAPTLRRLVHYYYLEGEHQQVADVARELEALSAPLDQVAVEAGLGIALSGDEARGTVVVAVAQPTAARLAEAVALARVRDLPALDPALRAAARALGGGDAGREALIVALKERVAERPAELGARSALGRIFDLASDLARARLHYAAPAFVDWTGATARRLRELPPPVPFDVAPERLVHPSALGPLREALTALAPLVLGLPPSAVPADPAPVWAEKLHPIAQALGLPAIECAVVTELEEPAWAEPTRPPRLLLTRRVLGDEQVAAFAAARALHALRAGVSLVEGRPQEDVAALFRAAAALFLPDLESLSRGAPSAFLHAWQAELKAIEVAPERLPEGDRARLEIALAACVVDATQAQAARYAAAERLTADRVALALTGDLRAALLALCPANALTPEQRALALGTAPALVELLAFTATL